MVRLAIKPDVVGKRFEFIHAGDRSTVADASRLPYEHMPFRVWVHWDSGSRLPILEGHDDYRTVYDNYDD